MLDLDFARSRFPALASPWALFDNAGGTAPCSGVIERVADHLARLPVQLGASYALSVEARAAVDAGRAAAARLFGARPEEVVFGASTTVLIQQLARVLRTAWQEGDEVVVTNLDHEANVGPWRGLERSGIVVREWGFRPDTLALHLEDLEPLLGPRTRLVAFTQASNVVGSSLDVAAIAERIRAAGALSCVDGVAHAPHRRVDVPALGCDFWFASFYKVFGPHLGVMVGRRDALLEAPSANHSFVPKDALPLKFEPGNANYELVASLVGIEEHLLELARRSGADATLDHAFELVTEHERELVRPLLGFLAEHPRTTLVGSADPDDDTRLPIVSFTVQDRAASELPPLLDERHLAVRYGHFYAWRLVRDLGLLERDGVVRVSLAHYNAPDEVQRLVEALAEVL